MVLFPSPARLLLFSLLLPATLGFTARGPEYLTVSSSGPAGKKHYSKMGVYRQSGETKNNKPVWTRHDGTMKLFYSNWGNWVIGPDPATNYGSVATDGPAGDQWPHQVRAWIYYNKTSEEWQSDPLLTVTEGAPPDYPVNITVQDLTGDRANLAGVYRRQGDSRVWKYGDFELSFNGKLWCISGDHLECQALSGWDYAEDFIWPNTDTLYIIGKGPEYLTVSSSGPAGEKWYHMMGVYRQSGETKNNKPVWSRHDGTMKLFYSNEGVWKIGSDPASDKGGVATVDPAGDQWPHQVRAWQYYISSGMWESDPLLTVTEGAPPPYPATLNVTDLTGDKANLAGVYRRQSASHVWKYGDYELSFNGKLWCISGDNLECQPLSGWDYAEDIIWPNTDTLYIIDYPASITVTSTGPAAEKLSFLMGRYVLEENKAAQLRPVYKKTDEDFYIYYSAAAVWMVSDDTTTTTAMIKSEKTGLMTIPTSGWLYSDPDFEPWQTDDTLQFIYNKYLYSSQLGSAATVLRASRACQLNYCILILYTLLSISTPRMIDLLRI